MSSQVYKVSEHSDLLGVFKSHTWLSLWVAKGHL